MVMGMKLNDDAGDPGKSEAGERHDINFNAHLESSIVHLNIPLLILFGFIKQLPD